MSDRVIRLEEQAIVDPQELDQLMRLVPSDQRGDIRLKRFLAFRLKLDGLVASQVYLSNKLVIGRKVGLSRSLVRVSQRRPFRVRMRRPQTENALCLAWGQGETGHRQATSIGAATSVALALSYSNATRVRANSRAVPGPWLVTQLPSTTTRSATGLPSVNCATNDGCPVTFRPPSSP